MAVFEVNFLEVQRLEALVKDFFVRFIDTERMHDGALNAFYEVEKKMFASGGGTEPWKPLTDKYRKWKDNKYSGMPIMQLTGQLKDSLTGNDSSRLTHEVSGDTLNVILTSSYWHNHQVGTTVPQRKTVNFTEADIDMIVESMLRATIGGRLSKFFTRG